MSNMKYWKVIAETPYCGEERREVIKAETYDKAEAIAWDIMYDNAMECYDDEAAEIYGWDDYLGSCDVFIYEITCKEYLNY